MAVVVADLTSPTGELDRTVLFPGDDASAFTARLTAYIAQGVTEATAESIAAGDVDAAVTAWAYYRAYDAVYQRLAASPLSVTLSDQGGSSYGASQAGHFKALAEAKLAEFEGLAEPTTTEPSTPVSRSRPNVAVW